MSNNIIDKIILYHREHGTKRTLRRVQSFLWRRLKYVVVLAPAFELVRAKLKERKDIDFYAINSSALSYVQWQKNIEVAFSEYPTAEVRAKKWFECGDIIIVGLIEKKVVWRSRLTRGDWLYDYFPVNEREGGIYHTDVYVPDTLRRKGVATSALAFAALTAYQYGGNKLWACIKYMNKPSIRLHEKSGYRQCGLIKYTSFCGKAGVKWFKKDNTVEVLSFTPGCK